MKRLVMIALALMVAVPAVGQVEFTFEGFAVYDPAPDQVGAMLTVYGIANPAVSVPTPVPVDFDNFQYTVVLDGMVVDTFAHDMVLGTKDYTFNGGTLGIFEDSIATGTAADYAAAPGTFVDGTQLIAATVDDGWQMHLDDPFAMGTYSGAGIGTCDIVGGADYAMLVDWGWELNDWVLAGTGISEPWWPFITVPDGYHHVFGVKLIYPHDPTANEEAAWGEVKSLFR
jgi:hypothetical protein